MKKIVIANRGEIALRVIRTAKEMGIKTVAVYSTADKDSLHVALADESFCIGPPMSKDSYLDINKIITVAELTKADAVHPGYGFLSENSAFAIKCQENNIKFIGPDPYMIEKMGDKASAKATMKEAGVPTVPGSEGIVANLEEALDNAQKIGYPVIIKATAGGGGKGMRIVNIATEFEAAWDTARREAKASFGNDAMYMEKFIVEPRHIEIQVLGDQYGKVVHFSERDCSVQRRHQKLIEETPSPFMNERLRKKMGAAAVRAAQAVNYEGVGTIEFLVDKYENFYFMEMNTRIQVEHPITEEVTGFDLIREQIKVAMGIPIDFESQFPKGHAIECRINAEDPEHNFRPSPGVIKTLQLPGGRGVRVDTHIYQGYSIPPFYDSMIAKLIVHADNREQAIAKMIRALNELKIEGIKSTKDFHLKVLQHKDFKAGNYTTNFIEILDN